MKYQWITKENEKNDEWTNERSKMRNEIRWKNERKEISKYKKKIGFL